MQVIKEIDMRKFWVIGFLVGASFMAQADLLSDIVKGDYKAATLPALTSMASGQYAALQGNAVLQFDYKTGLVTDTLFAPTDTVSLQGFVLSPSERYLLVYTNKHRLFRRSFEAVYSLYDRQQHTLTPLAEGALVRTPVFSPDSKYIAFAKGNNLFIHKIAFQTEVAVTTDSTALNGIPDWLYEEEFSATCLFAFSPDSKQLAFVRLDETEVPLFSWQTGMVGSAYPALQTIRYPRAGEENAAASVVVYDTYYKSLKTMQLPIGQYLPRLKWVNNDLLLVPALNRDQNKLTVYSASPKTTVCTPFYQAASATGWVDYALFDSWQLLPDGSFVVVEESDGWRHAWHYTSNGQRLQCLTPGAYDLDRVYGFDPVSNQLFLSAAKASPLVKSVYAYSFKKNKLLPLTSEQGTHQAAFSADFAYFLDTYSDLNTPPSVTLYDRNGRFVRSVLKNDSLAAQVSALGLPQKRFFSFVTERGDTLNGTMLLPLHFDEHTPYPVLQTQYSGPASQSVQDKWSFDWEYFLALNGVLVVSVDGRGTDFRGTAFRNATYLELGIKETEDQVSAARYLQTLPFVKPDKIGIWGWSYGGFMALSCLCRSSVFCCGIAVAPVTDWRFYDSAYTERFMRRPQVNESGYDQAALPPLAGALSGDLLLIHGLADDNVHCQHTFRMVDSLVEHNKMFEMQIYPDDNHFLRNRSNQTHVYQLKWHFLQQHLGL